MNVKEWAKLSLIDRLIRLCYMCETLDISMDLEYDVGRTVSGEHFDLNNPTKEVDPQFIKQGPKGWDITVGQYTDNKLTRLTTAVDKGYKILMMILEERKDKKDKNGQQK